MDWHMREAGRIIQSTATFHKQRIIAVLLFIKNIILVPI